MTERQTARDDVKLVRSAQAGDQAAFKELFQSYHQAVLNYAYRMIGDAGAAEDIVQDAFIRAHQHLARLGPPYDFKSWIYRIAGNLSLNYLKREKRLVQVDEFDGWDGWGQDPVRRRPPEERARREEVRASVWKTLDTIPSLYRQVLILREFNQFSYDEISRTLERSYDNVRQLVHRARVRFKEAHIGRLMLVEGPPRCAELGDLISAYRDEELAANERKAVKTHIASCADCQETEKDLRRVGALLALIPPIIPSKGWAAEVLEHISSSQSPPTLERIDVEEPIADSGRRPQEVDAPPPTRIAEPPSTPSPFSPRFLGPLALIGVGGLGMILALSLFLFFILQGDLPGMPSFSAATPTGQPADSSPERLTSTPVMAKEEGEGGFLSSGEDIAPTASPSATTTSNGLMPYTLTPTPTRTPAPTHTPTPTPSPTYTPTLAPPAAPSKLVVLDRVCSDTTYTVTLSWTDNASNEEGFHVYRGKDLIASLKADTTSYKDSPPGSGPYTYGVEAFNAAGTSVRPSVSEDGCLF
jgi:RNA polymerase sigma-70 factor (ECF subfamily)